jgi:trk system potassium uptake protein TrkA
MRVIIIGLSSYGIFLTEYLQDHEIEIVALDKDEERMNSVKALVSRPMIGNATNIEVLQELGVEEADTIIVALDSLETSVICVLHLQELHAAHIIAQAINGDHIKILQLLKVHDIVFPAKDMAQVCAQRLLHPNVLDIKTLTPLESLIEFTAPPAFVGQSLDELDLSAAYHAHLLFIKSSGTDEVILPTPEYRIQSGDILCVLGQNKALTALEKLRNHKD